MVIVGHCPDQVDGSSLMRGLLTSRRRLSSVRSILTGNQIWGKRRLSPGSDWRNSLLFRPQFGITVLLLHVEEMSVALLHMGLARPELLESHITVATRHKSPLSDPPWAISVMRHHPGQGEAAQPASGVGAGGKASPCQLSSPQALVGWVHHCFPVAAAVKKHNSTGGTGRH